MTDLVRLWCPCSEKIGRVARLDDGQLYLLLSSRSLLEIDGDVRFTRMGAGCFIRTSANGELEIEGPTPEYPCAKCQRICSLGATAPDLLRVVRTAIASGKRANFTTTVDTVHADSNEPR